MTKAEIAKMRSAFIDSMDKKMLTMTTAAEQRLLNAIIDKLFQTIGSNAESVLSDSGKVLKLSQAIENIFTNFKQSDEASIIREMIKGVSSIMSLNQQYFAKFDEQRLANYNKVFSDVDKQIKNRIGISEDGSIIKSGFLYRLMNDTTLQNKVIELTQKAEAQNWTTKDYLSQIRKTIVGDETIAGGITQHYRTFANDVHSQIDRAAAYGLAKGLGLRAFVYEGGLIETSREFCDKKDGKVFTIEETEQWKNDPDLLLTSDEKKGGVLQYDPIVDMGRWNCRHMESWIDKDQAIKMRPELKAYYKNGFVIEKVVEQTPPPKVDVVPLPPPPPPAPVVEPPVVLAQNDTVSQSMENIIQLDSDGIVLLRDNSFSGITTSKNGEQYNNNYYNFFTKDSYGSLTKQGSVSFIQKGGLYQLEHLSFDSATSNYLEDEFLTRILDALIKKVDLPISSKYIQMSNAQLKVWNTFVKEGKAEKFKDVYEDIHYKTIVVGKKVDVAPAETKFLSINQIANLKGDGVEIVLDSENSNDKYKAFKIFVDNKNGGQDNVGFIEFKKVDAFPSGTDYYVNKLHYEDGTNHVENQNTTNKVLKLLIGKLSHPIINEVNNLPSKMGLAWDVLVKEGLAKLHEATPQTVAYFKSIPQGEKPKEIKLVPMSDIKELVGNNFKFALDEKYLADTSLFRYKFLRKNNSGGYDNVGSISFVQEDNGYLAVNIDHVGYYSISVDKEALMTELYKSFAEKLDKPIIRVAEKVNNEEINSWLTLISDGVAKKTTQDGTYVYQTISPIADAPVKEVVHLLPNDIKVSPKLQADRHPQITKSVERIKRLTTLYKTKTSFVDVILRSKRIYARAGYGTISLGKNYFQDEAKFIAALKNDSKSGWHPRGTDTVQSVIDHEFGHELTLEDINKWRLIQKNPSRYSEQERMSVAHIDEFDKLFSEYKRQFKGAKKVTYDNVDFVSRYGATNLDEFICESFAMALNCPTPSRYALRIKALIDKYYKREGVTEKQLGEELLPKKPETKWLVPAKEVLQREFEVEHNKKSLNVFSSEEAFLKAVSRATIETITPEEDAKISYRSRTANREAMISLSSGYRSWGEFRSEKTIDAIYEGLRNGGDMELPIIFEFADGTRRVFAGNTRMDASFHLGINPKALIVKVPAVLSSEDSALVKTAIQLLTVENPANLARDKIQRQLNEISKTDKQRFDSILLAIKDGANDASKLVINTKTSDALKSMLELDAIMPKDMNMAINEWTRSSQWHIRKYEKEPDGKHLSIPNAQVSVGDLTAEQASKLIDSFFKVAPRFEGTIYRGIGDLKEDRMNYYKSLKVGNTYMIDATTGYSWQPLVSAGFMKTPHSREEDVRSIFFVVHQKNAAPINEWSAHNSEYELLMKRGSKFKVLKTNMVTSTKAEDRDFSYGHSGSYLRIELEEI